MEEPPGGLDVSVQARLVDPVRETGLSAIIVTHDLAVARLGLSPPTRAEMAEIEISSRLYRDAGAHCMTVVLPGRSETRTPASGISRDGLRGLRADLLQTALERVGRVGDLLGRVRLGLLTVERAVSFFGQTLADRADPALRPLVKGGCAICRRWRCMQIFSARGWR
jgi:hypothetical protein